MFDELIIYCIISELAIIIILLVILLLRLRRKQMTQQESHDQLLAALQDLGSSINEASHRVAAAISGAQEAIPNQDLLDSITNAKTTVNAIAPIVPVL